LVGGEDWCWFFPKCLIGAVGRRKRGKRKKKSHVGRLLGSVPKRGGRSTLGHNKTN